MNRQLRAEGAFFLVGSYAEKPGSYGDFEILEGAMVIRSYGDSGSECNPVFQGIRLIDF